jgi:hypothetical protein
VQFPSRGDRMSAVRLNRAISTKDLSELSGFVQWFADSSFALADLLECGCGAIQWRLPHKTLSVGDVVFE